MAPLPNSQPSSTSPASSSLPWHNLAGHYVVYVFPARQPLNGMMFLATSYERARRAETLVKSRWAPTWGATIRLLFPASELVEHVMGDQLHAGAGLEDEKPVSELPVFNEGSYDYGDTSTDADMHRLQNGLSQQG